jgi:hypothetical protein
MKKIISSITLFSSFLVLGQINLIEINSYSDLNGTKLVSLTSDNSLWTSNGLDTWTQINTTELPKNIEIKKLGSKSNLNLNESKTDLILILEDNSIWNLEDGISKWVKLQTTNLPNDVKIKNFKTYAKYNGFFDFETRLVLVLEDNSIWWSDGETAWEKIINTGLPQNYSITAFNTYQKPSMFGTETRLIITLSDNSFWWFETDEENWRKIETKNYPKDMFILHTDAYMKASIGSIEGRIISVFNDNSIMWMAVKDSNWIKLKSTELPKDIKITKMNVYSKLNMIGKGTRVILLLENNELWGWLAEKQSWGKINTSGIPISN